MSVTRGKVARDVRRHKLTHLGVYCPEPRCLWKTGGVRCPKHGGPAVVTTWPASAGPAKENRS